MCLLLALLFACRCWEALHGWLDKHEARAAEAAAKISTSLRAGADADAWDNFVEQASRPLRTRPRAARCPLWAPGSD